jgi:signal transduction histidine kinase
MFDSLIYSQYCYDYLVAQIDPGLLFYTHIPTAIIALIFSAIIFAKNRDTVSSSLLMICFLFTLWAYLDLNAWLVFLGAENTLFNWSLIDLIGICIFFSSFRFIYTFHFSIDLSQKWYLVSCAIILPAVLMTFLGLNITGYNTITCEAYENQYSLYYTYFVQASFISAILYVSLHKWRSARTVAERNKTLLATSGMSIFLFFLFSAPFVVNLLSNYTSVEFPYNYEIYGLFGMPVLLGYLGYLIVKYQAFNLKLISAQLLIVALLSLEVAQLFFYSTRSELYVKIATLIFTSGFGYFLVRSVQREIQEKERNERLAKDLSVANERLRELDTLKSEFVSIASHQLRSPITAIRGYTSMLLDGSFGTISEKLLLPIQRIEESSRFMALSVDDFLNVSRIESGSMKYDTAIFSLSKTTSSLVDDLRAAAVKRGLILTFKNEASTDVLVKADEGKVRQVLQNVIDNAMKYTPKGSVTVTLCTDLDKKRSVVAVVDTGVGMSKETLNDLFGKFVRAKTANTVNVYGTGLGLYIARKMIMAMGGSLKASSKGEGYGSTFVMELPLTSTSA